MFLKGRLNCAGIQYHRGIFIVSKTEWGKKHAWLNCGSKFYDLGREPIICPSCETPLQLEQPKRRRQKTDKSKEEIETNVGAETANDSDLLLDEDTEDLSDEDALIEDDNDNDESLLISADDDDDDDDIVVVDIDTRDE